MKRLLANTLVPLLVTALFVSIPTATAQEDGASEDPRQTLSGQVLDQDGRPVVEADVRVHQSGGGGPVCEVQEDGREFCIVEDSSGSYVAERLTDSDGRFSAPIDDGWTNIEVRKDGHASYYDGFEAVGSVDLQIELLRYPEKTARIAGTVTGGGQSLQYVSVSVENPEYGLYECSGRPGDDEPRPMPADGGGASGSSGGADPGTDTEESAGSTQAGTAEAKAPVGSSVEESPDAAIVEPGYYPYRECAIEVQEDGSFSGNVTPGYSLVRFHHESWRDDGQEFYAQTRVLDLAPDTTTRIDVDLVPRPGADASLSGYIVNGSSGEAIPDVQVSFSNQDAYGWASARTDADGSYRVALRSGYTQVHIWADGYFPWEGQVRIASGEDRAFDIVMTPGEPRYGGCCIAYAEGGEVRTLEAGDAAGAPQTSGQDGSGTATSSSGGGPGGSSQEGRGFEDLGGGLGPYDPASRTGSDDGLSAPGEGAPTAGVLLVLAALLGVLAMRRRR